MKVAIVNYGMGNLGSVRRALADLGAEAFIADRPQQLLDANRVVLPGVGAFTEGMTRLAQGGWVEPLQSGVEQGKALLGICLGMQMLGSAGDEGGTTRGLGLIEGTVRRLDALGCDLRVPHVGWNDLRMTHDEPLFAHIPQQSDFYFVHSYALVPAHADEVIGCTDYGVEFVAAVRKGRVFGTQFHPEKSSRAGRQLLRNFLDIPTC
jgi:imidazole glycerol-phosphate synthase subunit HisH